MAVLSEVDQSPDALEQELLTRTMPVAKDLPALPDEAKPQTEEIDQMKEHVLKSFMGELHNDLSR